MASASAEPFDTASPRRAALRPHYCATRAEWRGARPPASRAEPSRSRTSESESITGQISRSDTTRRDHVLQSRGRRPSATPRLATRATLHGRSASATPRHPVRTLSSPRRTPPPHGLRRPPRPAAVQRAYSSADSSTSGGGESVHFRPNKMSNRSGCEIYLPATLRPSGLTLPRPAATVPRGTARIRQASREVYNHRGSARAGQVSPLKAVKESADRGHVQNPKRFRRRPRWPAGPSGSGRWSLLIPAAPHQAARPAPPGAAQPPS